MKGISAPIKAASPNYTRDVCQAPAMCTCSPWHECIHSSLSDSSLSDILSGGYAALPRGMPKGVVGVDGEGGRLRRRAMFEDEDTVEVQRGSDDEEEEEEEEGEEAVDDEAEGEEESDDEGRRRTRWSPKLV